MHPSDPRSGARFDDRQRVARPGSAAWHVVFCALALALAAPTASRAALSDEIQVYADDINPPGEFGLELHLNATPRGRTLPDYPGEVVPHRGLRATPEFSYGLTRDFEVGAYLPFIRAGDGSTALAGVKLRLKWLPIHSAEHGGWFLGFDSELSRLGQRYSASRDNFELRTMTGWRGDGWLLALNPVLSWELSPGFRGASPELALSTKVARTVAPGLAVGIEHYAGLGTLARVLPSGQQDSALYAAIDWSPPGWELNFGIGRGLTRATDTLTVKAVVGFAF